MLGQYNRLMFTEVEKTDDERLVKSKHYKVLVNHNIYMLWLQIMGMIETHEIMNSNYHALFYKFMNDIFPPATD